MGAGAIVTILELVTPGQDSIRHTVPASCKTQTQKLQCRSTLMPYQGGGSPAWKWPRLVRFEDRLGARVLEGAER